MAKSTASGSGVGTSFPSGIVLPFAGDASEVPVGWLLCNGATVSRSSFRDLFNVIGTAWGEGDGASTFHIPDMRGTFLRGVDKPDSDPAAGRDPDAGTRTALNVGGNTGNNIGSAQGESLGPHNHAIGGQFNNQCCGSDIAMFTYFNGNPRTNYTAQTGNDGGVGNETRPKNVYVNYIIKV